ncbi:hypothetical protein V1525DRAFT_394001 [Lipomyces kononenkoae]|uniref:Uncharacterized protein n=1 Tax=Lipomyces kononenkoae TaxID=34357 RepID=A0ACC3TA23_LIPKO
MMRRALILIAETRSKLRKDSGSEKPLQNIDIANHLNDQNCDEVMRDMEASCSVYFTSPLSTLVSVPSAEVSISGSWSSTSLIAESDARDGMYADARGKPYPFAWIPSYYEYDADDNGMHHSREQSSLRELFLSQEISQIEAERKYINDMLSCGKTGPYHRRVVRYNKDNSAYYYRPVYGGKLEDICHPRLQFTAFVVGLDSVLSVETDVVLAMENLPKSVKRKYRARASNNLHKRRPRTRQHPVKKSDETAAGVHSDLILRVRTELATIGPLSTKFVRQQSSGTNSLSNGVRGSIWNGERKVTTEEQTEATAGVASLGPSVHNCPLLTALPPNTNSRWQRKLRGWFAYLESRLHKLTQRRSTKTHEYRSEISRLSRVNSLGLGASEIADGSGLRLPELSVRSTNSRAATSRTRSFAMAIRQLIVADGPCFNLVAHAGGSFFTSTPRSTSFDNEML